MKSARGQDRIDPAWNCRDYRSGDEDQILQLFTSVFGEKKSFRALFGESRSKDFWRWQYLEPPAGAGVIKLLFDGSRLIGHYAVIPVEMCVQGKPTLAALSLDTMVHPAYRRRGILTHLATLVYEQVSERGIGFIYGFPNRNSYAALVNNLGWVGFGTVTTFVADASELETGAVPLGHSRTIVPIEEFGADADLLWNCQEREKVAVNRTARYLNWRFVLKPNTNYSRLGLVDSEGDLLGYAVTKLYQEEDSLIGHIVDFLCKDDRDVSILLEACYSRLLRANASRITCWASGQSAVTARLRHDGFRVEKMPTFFGARTLASSPELSVVLCYDNWHVMMGDSDVF